MSDIPAGESIVLHGARILVAPGLLDRIGPELREALPHRRFAIISDDTVAPLYAARVAAACAGVDPRPPALFTVPAGEGSKTRREWARLTDELLSAGFGRDSAVLALGGGVVGDLAGFVAATYMRGIPVVQLPTTLLAMIDAAIGGKTGVDTDAGKNLVGAFHHPALVLADPTALATLPPAQLRNGMAEAVKHGIIANSDLFIWLTANAASIATGALNPDAAARLVARNVRIKADVVARDEREAGVRKILNFGHTIGHAVETLSGYSLLHGECIAIGMVVEARIAAIVGLVDTALVDAIRELLEAIGLPVAVPAGMSSASVLEATRSDKKARGGAVEYALPAALGEMAASDRGFAIAIPDYMVNAALGDCRR